MHFWAITLWTWIIYVPLMSIHLIVILFAKQNILILFKRNPCVTKTSHMWKSLLIFFFCILIIDIFHFWRCSTKGAALRKELLYERSRTSFFCILIIDIFHLEVLYERSCSTKEAAHPLKNNFIGHHARLLTREWLSKS